MNSSKNNLKSSKGQLATLMNLIIAICVIGVIGLFAFELTRYFLAHDELKTNVEVAALSCQTALASSGDPTSATNQQAAQATGLQLFKQNSILGAPMSGATLVSDPASLEPAPSNAQICFQFLDPLTRLPVNATGAGVASGVTSPSAAGTLIKAIGAYCYAPAFGQFVGLGAAQFTFQVSALSGVPKIDLLVLLDISGSMDDDTSVSFYQRYEGPTGTNWMILPNPVGGGTATGQLWSVWCPEHPGDPPIGANALPPMQLEQIDGSTCYTVHYSEGTLGGPSHLLAGAGMGTPPGNAGVGCSSMGLPDENKQLIASNSKKVIHGKKIKTARHNSSRLISANPDEKSKLKSTKPTDPGLLEICQKISGKKSTKSSLKKLLASQLDDKFSKVYFKPAMISLGTSTGTTGTTAGTSTGVNYTGTTPNDPGPVPPPTTYVSTDSMKYVPNSHASGALADTTTVQPTIAGIGCISGVTTIVVGAPAQAVFTGLVVNGVVGAHSTTNPQFVFNNLATAVEAMQGDLESASNAQQAGIDTGALGVTPQAGWYAFYYQAARAFLQPMMANMNALIAFVNEMAIISDIHYGFVAFNDSIGTDANSISGPINNVSSAYNYTTPNPYGNNSINCTFPLPNIALSPTDSKQSAIINMLPSLSMWGGRNVTQALQQAATQLQNNGRSGANKAIILITAGPPNNTDTPAAAIAQATTIGQSGIPIYVICTAISPDYDSPDDDAYTDVGGAGGGIAAAAGHGGKYYRVDYVDPPTTQNKLSSIFANIARRLVSIVPNS